MLINVCSITKYISAKSEILFVFSLITLTTNTSYNDDIVTKFSILLLLILNSVNFNDIILNVERDRLIQLVILQTHWYSNSKI